MIEWLYKNETNENRAKPTKCLIFQVKNTENVARYFWLCLMLVRMYVSLLDLGFLQPNQWLTHDGFAFAFACAFCFWSILLLIHSFSFWSFYYILKVEQN